MTTEPDTLRRYLDLLVESLDEDVQTSDLARRAYLSRYHFDRLIRAALGEPPATLRRRLLLERAAFILANTDRTATAIAFEAGYDSLGAFSRAFARAYGSAPKSFRARTPRSLWIRAPNDVHFHPPAGVMIAAGEETHMDLTERLIEHDLWLTRQILERATTLTDAQLDRPLALGDAWVDEVAETTLRGLLDHLVFNKENWTAVLDGKPVAVGGDRSAVGLRRRFAAIEPLFRDVINGIRNRGDWDTSFIDATCDPPETFTHGGAIAHVITFSAHRRELVIGALRKLGVTDLGYGDPKDWERLKLAR